MVSAREFENRTILSGDGFAAHEIVSSDGTSIIRKPGESLKDFTKRAAKARLGSDATIIQVGGNPRDAELDISAQPAPNGL